MSLHFVNQAGLSRRNARTTKNSSVDDGNRMASSASFDAAISLKQQSSRTARSRDVPPGDVDLPPYTSHSVEQSSMHRERPVFPNAALWTQTCVATGDLDAVNPGCAEPSSLWEVRTSAQFRDMDVNALAVTLDLDFHLPNLAFCDFTSTSGYVASDPRWNCVAGGAEGERLVRTSWALMRNNRDLLEYAMCWVIRSQESTVDVLHRNLNLERELSGKIASVRDVLRGQGHWTLRMYQEVSHWS